MPAPSNLSLFGTPLNTTAPTDAILTLNAGSSSIKYALFASDGDLSTPLLSGSVEELGTGAGAHAQALQQVLQRLGDGLRVRAVGHRIVHGGTQHDRARRIDAALEADIAALAPFAPLHQPHNLAGVIAARAAFPGVPQVACFDTAFHRTIPELNQRFALPERWFQAGVRRYGFHGLSYAFVAGRLREIDPALAAGKVVVAHLGNGASMCAMEDGRSVASTMGFSTLDGLPMGTRCGRLDAGVLLHLMAHEGLDEAALGRLLYKESGLLGLSGVSSDMRRIEADGGEGAQRAVAYFVEHCAREIAALAAALRGIDGLVFTGGIGENAQAVRARIVQALGWMGLTLDEAANSTREGCISTAASRVRVHVIRTNEEAVIARQTARLMD